ncbi:hypothetical protein TIFTF001_018860 [Ficus carica]|uniref:Uncharacterized protein n=1 Tax=Ficus carica TaxID=3494 RepID=A0AA88AC86_FICCA|nr:hypothetical protein TIFTF001_018860 [Ficus carica]
MIGHVSRSDLLEWNEMTHGAEADVVGHHRTIWDVMPAWRALICAKERLGLRLVLSWLLCVNCMALCFAFGPELLEVQLPGKNAMNAAAFCNGLRCQNLKVS